MELEVRAGSEPADGPASTGVTAAKDSAEVPANETGANETDGSATMSTVSGEGAAAGLTTESERDDGGQATEWHGSGVRATVGQAATDEGQVEPVEGPAEGEAEASRRAEQ